MSVFALSVHAQYACRHSGACCTAGWNIPVESRLRGLIGTALLVPDADGACPYFDRPSELCRIHRDHGEAQLPASCHQFPRRALVDDRGVFVTLSHFCPTAAAALVDAPSPLHIVDDPPAFPPDRAYEGLDARGAWPPLVRPSVLFDLDSYSRWEQFVVATCARSLPVRETLSQIAAAAERLRAWTPERGTLQEWTATALEPAKAAAGEVGRIYARLRDVGAYDHVCRVVPDGLDRPAVAAVARAAVLEPTDPVWNEFAAPVNRYLAAKGFASWCAYQGRGVRTMVADLMVAETVLRVEAARACAKARRRLDRDLLLTAVRQADLLLMHLADREALTRRLGGVEFV